MNISGKAMQPIHLSRIDLNLLVSLETLLVERSVTQAARQLGLSQSAMSHQLRRLRELFDDPLLVAGKGGLVATPLAEAIAGPVRRALADLGRAIRGEVDFNPATAQRTFVIAAKDAVEILGLPALIDLIAREAPGVRADSQVLTPGTLASLQEGGIDLAIGPDLEEMYGVRFPGIRKQVLKSDVFACVVRQDHPAVHGEMTLELFLSLQHVVVLPDTRIGRSVDDELHKQGLKRKVTARISHFMSAPFVVAQSDLVAVLPRNLAEHFAMMVPLQIFATPLELPNSELVMTWHERFNDDPANRWLREVVARLSVQVDSRCCAGAGLPSQAV
jgi:DNA-binding transcriptional LysR family regulator